MHVIEIIGAILLIVSCISIVVLVLMQDSSKGMSQSLTGASGDNYFQKNSGRTKEARLKRFTKIATIILFVVTIAVNVAAIYIKPADPVDPNEIDLSDMIQSEFDAANSIAPETTDTPDATEPPASE